MEGFLKKLNLLLPRPDQNNMFYSNISALQLKFLLSSKYIKLYIFRSKYYKNRNYTQVIEELEVR